MAHGAAVTKLHPFRRPTIPALVALASRRAPPVEEVTRRGAAEAASPLAQIAPPKRIKGGALPMSELEDQIRPARQQRT